MRATTKKVVSLFFFWGGERKVHLRENPGYAYVNNCRPTSAIPPIIHTVGYETAFCLCRVHRGQHITEDIESGVSMLISRWTELTTSRCSLEVNLTNTLVVSTRQMDENQTNWKSYSIDAAPRNGDSLISQMNFILPARPLANRLSFVSVR